MKIAAMNAVILCLVTDIIKNAILIFVRFLKNNVATNDA